MIPQKSRVGQFRVYTVQQLLGGSDALDFA